MNVVIQCPKCQTKFEVPDSVLKSASASRFHCSRCDTIFASEDARPLPAIPEATTRPAEPEVMVGPAVTMSDSLRTETPASTQSSAEKSTFFKETEVAAPTFFEEESEEDEEEEYSEEYDDADEEDSEEYEDYEEDSEEEDEESEEDEDDSDYEDEEEEEDDEDSEDEEDEESDEEDDEEYEDDDEDLEEEDEDGDYDEEDDEEDDDEEEYDEEDDEEELDEEDEELEEDEEGEDLEEEQEFDSEDQEEEEESPFLAALKSAASKTSEVEMRNDLFQQKPKSPEQVDFPFDSQTKKSSGFASKAFASHTSITEDITFPEKPIAPSKGTVVGLDIGREQTSTEYRQAEAPSSSPYVHTSSAPDLPEPPPNRSITRAVTTIGFPMALFLLALFVAGEFLKEDTYFARTITDLILEEAPRVAPADLRIRDLNYDQLTLTSGTKLPVIRGKVTNRSDTSYQKVLIEAVLFDKLGNPQSIERIPLENDLRAENLPDLTPEVIQQLQKGAKKNRKGIAPGENKEFIVAFPAQNKNLKFYTARIYSVSNKS